MTTPSLLLKAWNIHPKKKWGQNFLNTPSTAQKIIKAAQIRSEDIVLEIGAGLGALTIPAAQEAKKVYALERDEKIIPLLKGELTLNNISNVEIISNSILKVDLLNLERSVHGDILIIGNLPYNISSQILIRLVPLRSFLSRAILMFQKELALRLVASPCCKEYGRISVMMQYCANIKILTHVTAANFFPKPKIDSTVLEIEFKKEHKILPEDESFFFKVVKVAFGKRRKTLKNALLKSDLKLSQTHIIEALISASIDPSRRAETLTVSEFINLSNELWQP